MICPFCNKCMLLVVTIESAFYNVPPTMNHICRSHRPFIVGVMNFSHEGHYGYWVAINGIQIIVNFSEEITIVNKYKSVYECCGKKFAKKKFPFLYRNGWCYGSPFFEKRLYTIDYMMDVSPESFNDFLKRIERLNAFS